MTPDEARIRADYNDLPDVRKQHDPVWVDFGILLAALDDERANIAALVEAAGVAIADAVFPTSPAMLQLGAALVPFVGGRAVMGNAGNRDRGPWGATCRRCGEQYRYTNLSIRHIRLEDGRHEVSDQHDVGCRRRHGEVVYLIRNGGRGDVIRLSPFVEKQP